MPAPRKVAVLLDHLSLRSPGQQLLDRFLIGYPRDGEFHRPAANAVVLHVASGGERELVEARQRDFGLEVAATAEAAATRADAVIVASGSPAAPPPAALMKAALDHAAPRAALFVYGSLVQEAPQPWRWHEAAARRALWLRAGTAMSTTWRLPETEVPSDITLREALIVAQGPLPLAELEALDGLQPLLERRRAGESGVRRLRFLSGKEVWRAGEAGEWSWDLLAAALSRSHTPQGDPVLDGRTQDLAGLGLVPLLAREPRAWLLQHRDGLRTTVLVLDGVVKDFNFALRPARGPVISAQLFRAPPGAEQHFSRLAAALDQWFQSGQPPWALERSLLTARLLEEMCRPESRAGGWVAVS